MFLIASINIASMKIFLHQNNLSENFETHFTKCCQNVK